MPDNRKTFAAKVRGRVRPVGGAEWQPLQPCIVGYKQGQVRVSSSSPLVQALLWIARCSGGLSAEFDTTAQLPRWRWRFSGTHVQSWYNMQVFHHIYLRRLRIELQTWIARARWSVSKVARNLFVASANGTDSGTYLNSMHLLNVLLEYLVYQPMLLDCHQSLEC